MNKTFKEVLLYTLIPLGIFLLICLTGDEGILGAGILLLLLVAVYFILGLVLLVANNAHLGKVLLLSSGIILLVGLSTCGMMMNGMNFH
ncbi:hypothetical protein [Chitinophaga arvensicola]|uniref:Uncharacterized protein n=1 Tax=Chitinophaga arvensicola TaxID=29529 RepID=A0A1I0ND27_9BACT|nr:hypothetical protein [Chitinophaga arvensicola]SEV99307.1 hypothetical protein SAMN04488122_0109 [Chitinophaga arvensicola]